MAPLLRLALPMGAAAVCQQAYFWVDNLFVRASLGEAWLGRYNLAVRVMSLGIMAGVYAALAALPWLTREHAAGRLGRAVTRLAAPTFALSLVGTAALWPFAGDLLVLLGGEEHFRQAEPALQRLLLATAAVYLGAPLLTGVVAAGRGGAVLGISAVALLTNLLLNALWVPTRGIEGAALATLVTELMVAAGAAAVLTGVARTGAGRPPSTSPPAARPG